MKAHKEQKVQALRALRARLAEMQQDLMIFSKNKKRKIAKG